MVAPRFFVGVPKRSRPEIWVRRPDVDSSEIRERFFKFFEAKNHVRLPSAPLVLKDDPSVLFTTAGMQPLVPYFLGRKQPPAKRIVTDGRVVTGLFLTCCCDPVGC